MAIDKQLLDILVCPECKGVLELTEAGDGLICHSCRVTYPVIDDIPVMLTDEAIPLEKDTDTRLE